MHTYWKKPAGRPAAGCFGLLACLTVAAHASAAFYSLGIYAVNDTNDLTLIKAAGFTLVTGPATASFLGGAQRVGLKVLASPGTSAGRHFDATGARRAVARFDRHPALWAWYLADEPDMHLTPPVAVLQAHRFFKSLSARRPTALSLFQGYEAWDYGQITDITLVDRYPIPWLPLANFGQHVRLARLALGKGHPLIAIIQAFDWRCYPELLRGQGNLRPPTFPELRCMTYCALAEGADGLFYYAYDDRRWKMKEHPETWSALQAVVREVSQRRPLFQAEHLWWPKDHRFAEGSRAFNAALESSVTSTLLRVPSREGSRAVPVGQYVLAVNNTDQALTYSFTVPQSGAAKLPVLDEGRHVDTAGDRATDTFEPYAVHVYGPLPFAGGKTTARKK